MQRDDALELAIRVHSKNEPYKRPSWTSETDTKSLDVIIDMLQGNPLTLRLVFGSLGDVLPSSFEVYLAILEEIGKNLVERKHYNDHPGFLSNISYIMDNFHDQLVKLWLSLACFRHEGPRLETWIETIKVLTGREAAEICTLPFVCADDRGFLQIDSRRIVWIHPLFTIF